MKAGEVLEFSASRKIVVLYKRFLDLLIDLRADSEANLDRLEDALSDVQRKLDDAKVPVSVMSNFDQFDWFDEDKLQRLRKTVLDLGNDLKRELQTEIQKYNISL